MAIFTKYVSLLPVIITLAYCLLKNYYGVSSKNGRIIVDYDFDSSLMKNILSVVGVCLLIFLFLNYIIK